jgi:hypothetical protein
MSEKTVAQKLGLKAGQKLLIQQPPEQVAALLGALPPGAEWITAAAKPSTLILMFAQDKAALVKELPACKRQLAPGGALWVAYIKGTSARKTDINRDSIREFVGTIGLDTVAQIALDDDWSALRLKVVQGHPPLHIGSNDREELQDP